MFIIAFINSKTIAYVASIFTDSQWRSKHDAPSVPIPFASFLDFHFRLHMFPLLVFFLFICELQNRAKPNLSWATAWDGTQHFINIRSTHPEVFCKCSHKFCKIFRKTPVLEPQACSFVKKDTWHKYFSVNFVKFLWTLFFTEDLWLPLLKCRLHLIFWSVQELIQW